MRILTATRYWKLPLFLLDCPLPECVVRQDFPDLWQYLQSGKETVSGRYLCRSRKPWYSQENRPAPTFLCTYMGRGKKDAKRTPFRFILNHSNATAANVYLLLYPKLELSLAISAQPTIKKRIWKWLNGLTSDTVTSEGRVYGGGLYKIEPRELGNVPADSLGGLLGSLALKRPTQADLFPGNSLQISAPSVSQ